MSSLPAPIPEASAQSHVVVRKVQAALNPIAVLVVVPTLDGGAADAGAVELVRILASAGFRATSGMFLGARAGNLLSTGPGTGLGGRMLSIDRRTVGG